MNDLEQLANSVHFRDYVAQKAFGGNDRPLGWIVSDHGQRTWTADGWHDRMKTILLQPYIFRDLQEVCAWMKNQKVKK